MTEKHRADGIRKRLNENMEKARHGKKLWQDLTEKLNLGTEDYVILLPSLNKEYNYYSLLYMNRFIKAKKIKNIAVLTYDEDVKLCAGLFCDKAEIVDFNRSDAESLMRFYQLYPFTSKLIVFSLEEPNGRVGKILADMADISREEFIVSSLYGLEDFYKAEPPIYNGNNKKIERFLRQFRYN